MKHAIYIAFAALLAGPASAGDGPPAVTVRSGSHPNFGRVVFDTPPETRYQLKRDGERVTIEFSAPTVLGTAPSAPRNMLSLRTAGAQAALVLTAAANLREARLNGHVVIDVLDPDNPSPPAKSVPPSNAYAPSSSMQGRRQKFGLPVASIGAVSGGAQRSREREPADPSKPTEPAHKTEALGPPAPTDRHESPEHPAAAAAAPQGDTGESVSHAPEQHVSAAERTAIADLAYAPSPLSPDGAAFTVPFGPHAGAAVFRQAGTIYVVFDERRSIDIAALRDSALFKDAAVQELQTGTLVVIRPPPEAGVVLSKLATGWKIAIQPGVKAARPIPFLPKDGRLELPADAPGTVVSMANPTTGATLLIGTMRAPGQAVLSGRKATEFLLLSAVLGVVVEPIADTVTLRTVPTGFLLSGGPAGLALTAPTAQTNASAAAAQLTRRFKIPNLPTEALARRLSQGIADAAATPARARGPRRRAVASTMLALGMGAEAQSLLLTTAAQDPKEAAAPDTIGLTAIGAMLANRFADAAGIDDDRLTGTDDVALWRAVRDASAEEGSPSAAAVFSATAPLILLYPRGIRDRILPLAAETMVLGGSAAAAKRMIALAADAPGLGFAKALLKQTDGDVQGALAMLDALAAGHDQQDRIRSATRAVELRLAGRQLDAGQAADVMDQLRVAWRGDRRELTLRERVADLRQRAGNWRAALDELRSAEKEFPDHAAAVHAHLMGMFITMLYSDATDALKPLDLVALADENADLFQTIPDNPELTSRLADRLLALDLPSRAAPLLEKLAANAPSPVDRAVFGARLAELRLGEEDAQGAIAALSASAAADLDPALTERRATVLSAAKVRLHDTSGAIKALEGLTGPHAETARAAVYEQAGDWIAATEALMNAVGTALPDSGTLTEPQLQLVLRLATAAERAGDRNTLDALRATLVTRLGSGTLADTIRLLTAEPVHNTSDLPRSDRELGLAHAVPAVASSFKAP